MVEGAEAHHAARVKRLAVGDRCEVFSGCGHTAHCTVVSIEQRGRGEAALALRIEGDVRTEPVLSPVVEVWAAAPKGDRLEAMVDGLSQVGAARYRPLVTHHSERTLDAKKLDKFRRVSLEAAKQCSRPWLLEIDEPATLDDALTPEVGLTVLLAGIGDAPLDAVREITPGGRIRLLVGPEGDWSEAERERVATAGVRSVGLGPLVMRVETAAVVGAAMLMAASGSTGTLGETTTNEQQEVSQ